MSKVPNTISDKEWAKLQARANKAAPPLLSKEAVKKRIASTKQQNRADQS